MREVFSQFGVSLTDANEVVRNAIKMQNPEAMQAHAERFGERSANKLRSVTPGDFVIWGKDHFMTMNVTAGGKLRL